MKRKLFCLLTLLLAVCSGAWADEDGYTTDALKATPYTSKASTGKNFTLSSDAATSSSNGMRLAETKSFTITANSGITIDEIVLVTNQSGRHFTSSPAVDPTQSSKTYTYTFTTNPTSVSFTNPGSGNIDVISISITYTTSGGGGSSYTVTYDPNGGSGSMDDSEGASITLSANTFTAPTDYTFDGWNTEANGSGTAYTDKQSGITKNLDLFAQWKQTVTLDKNGGTKNGSVVAHYNGTLGDVTAPTYADHTVTGYYNDAGGTTKVLNADGSFADDNVTGYITAGAWTHSGATTLYAQWEEAASVKAEAPVYKLHDGGANVTEISANNYMFATASGTTKFRVKAQPYTYVRYTVGENEMPAAPTLTSGTEIKNQTGKTEKESSNIECSTHTKTYYVRAIAWDADKTPESASDEVVLVVAANQVTVTIASACTYDGKFYATFSNDKAFVVPADLTVSAVGISDKKLVVTNYTTDDVVKANTGVMLSSETAGNKTITLSAETGIEKSGNYLKASSVAMTGDNLFYRLTMHNPDTENKIGFWWGAEEGAAFSIAANKAYLAVPTGEALARGLWFDEGETTAISEVRGLKADVRGEFYDLSGRKVAQPTKGLYIVNGRKVVIK